MLGCLSGDKVIGKEGAEETFWGDENVLYLYEEGSCMGIRLSNFVKLYN